MLHYGSTRTNAPLVLKIFLKNKFHHLTQNLRHPVAQEDGGQLSLCHSSPSGGGIPSVL